VLTPEEMARIEADERRKHAEELYRLAIRQKLNQPADRPKSERPSSGPSFANYLTGIGVLALVTVIVLLAVNFFGSSGGSNTGSPAGLGIERALGIASGQIFIPAGANTNYRFTVTPEMHQAVLSGSFSASGGTGNDILAIVATEGEATNWMNGHQAMVIWQTPGRETTGNFNVHLGPGTYCLVFGNKFSAFTGKQVSVTATLSYRTIPGF